MTELAVYVGLFLTLFAAATLVPAQSETALAVAVAAGYPPLTAVAVASVGNVLGSIVNWFLGRSRPYRRHPQCHLLDPLPWNWHRIGSNAELKAA